MFDDPKKNLRQMEEALLAVEYEDENPDDSDWLEEAKALLGDEEDTPVLRPNPRNRAVAFDRTVFADEEPDEDAAVYLDKPRKKGIGKLVILALLELAGIAALIVWWIQWLN